MPKTDIRHGFTPIIEQILDQEFGDGLGAEALAKSPLIRYLNVKTRSADRGSKARGSFANIYAVYVLVEDYVDGGFGDDGNDYGSYPGAKFSDLFRRQRQLPFGSKLQNHALNHRLNEEFRKYFPDEGFPIARDPDTNRYWVNEHLLLVEIGGEECNLGPVALRIIEAYVRAKRDAFDDFIADCERLAEVGDQGADQIREFVEALLRPNVDARLFELVSFAILKTAYAGMSIHWGWRTEALEREPLQLFKTGRTNANDGGIDFVMKPLGRFFQVTEDLDVSKYFLDIDKIHRYPITFVVKSTLPADEIIGAIRKQAERDFGARQVVERYVDSIEEVINIPALIERLDTISQTGEVRAMMHELVDQSRLEFNSPLTGDVSEDVAEEEDADDFE